MNALTRKIRNKGHSLSEFLSTHKISLRTYRRWEKEGSKFNVTLNAWIDQLEVRNEAL